MIRIVVVLMAVAISTSVVAQRKGSGMRMMKPPKPVVCYASSKNESTTIGPPEEYLKRKRPGAARTQSANFIVTYEDFTPQAQAAFQEAVDIWESLLESPVTIRIHARWTTLGAGVLGSAGPGTYLTNFDDAPKRNVWYPVALAEKIAGKDLNDPADPDIVASFNSANDNWHYGLTGSEPQDGDYDLVSIVLHEIGHGLGITHGYSIESGQGVIPDYFLGQPVVYETNIETATGKNFVNDFTPPAADLATAITSQNLSFVSRIVRTANDGKDAKIYAPSTYSAGSSVAHLDEDTYKAGNINSLMTPFIGSAERMLDPGPISLGILKEIGWFSTVVEHTPLKSTENAAGPFHVVAKVISDGAKDSVTVGYKTNFSDETFNLVFLAPTGNPNEYAGDIPAGSSKYWYCVAARDIHERTLTTPGIIVKPGSDPVQGLIYFEAGPDNKPPVITHLPKEFITNKEPLEIQAIVSDNIGIDNVKVEWQLNGVAQSSQFMALVPDTDSTYALSINFVTPLETDDKIEYRIRAEDSSIAGSVAYKPSSTTFFEVNVTGLGDTRDSYVNDFDDLSAADFFGNGFAISKPSGFDNGAIHADHPYAAGGAEGAHLDFIYNLKSPIRISETNAILKFDEIVLVEPGEDGVAWPDADFYDYVVVEGSVDGGITWTAIADGYDARFNNAWLNLWKTTLSDNNSTGAGTPSLYRTHSFNLLDKFQAGDEVAFRFRLYSDPFSFGWGWSIDNLKIQVDDTPPLVQHQHYDYVLEGTAALSIETKVTDQNGIKQIFVDYNVNGGSVTTTEIIVNPATDTYTQNIDLSTLGLGSGDEFQYKIRALDQSNNTGTYPSTGFIKVAVVSFDSSVDEIVTDFTVPSSDLTGNFFNIDRPSAFPSPGMNSSHPYEASMGIDERSDFSWLTKKPVKVSATNDMIYFEDVAIVEYGTTPKDYVIVEASKDGVVWDVLLDPYDASAVPQWKTAYDNGSPGTSSMLQKHYVRITDGEKFKAGDLVLIRFRLRSNATTTGWGWLVDNLSIQGSITGLEPTTTGTDFEAWPNPVSNGSLHLKLELPGSSEVSVEIFTTQGQLLSNDRFSAPSGDSQRDYDVNNWPVGFYVVRISSDFGTAVKKIVRTNSQN